MWNNSYLSAPCLREIQGQKMPGTGSAVSNRTHAVGNVFWKKFPHRQ